MAVESAASFIDATFIVGCAFFLFVGLAFRPLAKMITGGLNNRENAIKNNLEEAKNLKNEARELLASTKQKHQQAVKDAEHIVENATQESKNLVTNAKTKLEQDVEKRTKNALQKIAQAEANVTRDIKERAVDATINAAHKMISENLEMAVAEELLSDAISNVSKKLH